MTEMSYTLQNISSAFYEDEQSRKEQLVESLFLKSKVRHFLQYA